MNPHNPYAQLALRVKRGEPAAARHFREHMAPQMELTVRTAMQGVPVANSERILAEVYRVLDRSRGIIFLDSADLAAVVADRLCDDLIDRLQAAGRAEHRLPPACARETVIC